MIAILVIFLVFLAYFASINLIYIVLSVIAQFGNAHRLKEAKYTDFKNLLSSFLTIPVSIIVPAYNEERVVADCVYSCGKLNYPEYEIIVVNDGSTDDTLGVLQREFDLYPVDHYFKMQLESAPIKTIYRSKRYENLIVVDKENAGKADAENAGYNLAKYGYICCTDSDTIFDRDGILRLMRPVLLDPGKVVAVGGQIRIGNNLTVRQGEVAEIRLPKKIIPAIQVVEYLRSFIANRLGWSSLNAQLVISGAFGLFRRDAVLAHGGFSTTTTHEDIEMTFGLHEYYRRRKDDYSIISMPDPVTWTEVPQSLRAIMRQRERWQRVVIETFWRYKRMLLNPRYGTVGLLGMTYYLIYEIWGPFVELAGYAFVIIAASLGVIRILEFGLFVIVSIGLAVFITLLGLLIEQYNNDTYKPRQLPALIALSVMEPIWFRQVTALARSYAVINVVRGKKGWKSPKRKGF